MTVRYERVEPCEHGEWNPHRSGDGEIVASSDGAEIMAVICRGASRKAFTEWPPEAIEAAAVALGIELNHPVNLTTDPPEAAPNTRRIAEQVLAAAWGHITGDSE